MKKKAFFLRKPLAIIDRFEGLWSLGTRARHYRASPTLGPQQQTGHVTLFHSLFMAVSMILLINIRHSSSYNWCMRHSFFRDFSLGRHAWMSSCDVYFSNKITVVEKTLRYVNNTWVFNPPLSCCRRTYRGGTRSIDWSQERKGQLLNNNLQ